MTSETAGCPSHFGVTSRPAGHARQTHRQRGGPAGVVDLDGCVIADSGPSRCPLPQQADQGRWAPLLPRGRRGNRAVASSRRRWALSLAVVSPRGLGCVLGEVAATCSGVTTGPGRPCGGSCGGAGCRPGRRTPRPERGRRRGQVVRSIARRWTPGDQGGQHRGWDRGRCPGEPLRGLWAVEADQGVEVDGAAQLVLGNIGVLQAHHLTQPSRGGAEVVGQVFTVGLVLAQRRLLSYPPTCRMGRRAGSGSARLRISCVSGGTSPSPASRNRRTFSPGGRSLHSK